MPLEHVVLPFCGRLRAPWWRTLRIKVCDLYGITIYLKNHYKGALHTMKTKVARHSGDHEKAQNISPPLPAFANRNPVVLVSPGLPATAASGQFANDSTSTELPFHLSEKNFDVCFWAQSFSGSRLISNLAIESPRSRSKTEAATSEPQGCTGVGCCSQVSEAVIT